MNNRKKRAAWIATAAALTAGAIVAQGLANVVAQPIRRTEAIALPDWPARLPPMRVALLSDIHFGNRGMRASRLDAIVDAVNASKPDLVLLAGDYVNGHGPAGAAASAAGLVKPLARLRARQGIIAVLGNHDHWTDPQAIRRALAAAHVTVLENRAVQRGGLSILGIDDDYSGHADVRATLAASHAVPGARLVLTHAPSVLPKLPGDLPLVLAGHTHCGQVVLPLRGPLLTRSPFDGWKPLYDPHYRCGLIRDANRTVVVTSGLGTGTSPVRYGTPPDWWLLTLGPVRAR